MRLVGLFTLALLAVLSAPLHAEDETLLASILKKMEDTVRVLDYSGEFVYQYGDVLNAMHVTHTWQNGYEREHLTTLTGAAREVVRDNFTMTRLTPGNESVSVSERQNKRRAPMLAAFDPSRLEGVYQFQLLGMERVAGRATHIVAVIPKDSYRYGHRIYLDEETALPLRRIVLDKDGKYVSQLMFTSIDINGNPEGRMEVDKPGGEEMQAAEVVDYTGPWFFDDLPPGFELEVHDQRQRGDEIVDHFVFSDGIAQLSLYIEKDISGDVASTRSHVGPVGILAAVVSGYRFTVVGEAPLDTLKLFIRSARRTDTND